MLKTKIKLKNVTNFIADAIFLIYINDCKDEGCDILVYRNGCLACYHGYLVLFEM